MTNFQRTAAWLHACGKERNAENLSVQIGVHIEEFVEFLQALSIDDPAVEPYQIVAADLLEKVASSLKKRNCMARIEPTSRVAVLDSLCDQEVTLNGVAYLAGFDKESADQAVLDSNDSKLEDGRPVILPGGKIGKGRDYKAPDLQPFV